VTTDTLMLFLSLELELAPAPELASEPELAPAPALAPELAPEPELAPVLTVGVPDAIAVAGMSPIAAAATAAPSVNARNFMIAFPLFVFDSP